MYHNNYSVRIPQGKEVEDGYVQMMHNTEYSLVLKNSHNTRCNAEVWIDGERVGGWRIESYDSVTIERPADAQRRFTFYKLGTPESAKAELKPNSDLGLISVKFTPEFQQQAAPNPFLDDEPRAFRLGGSKGIVGGAATRSVGGARGSSAGGTGLGRHSDQRFGVASYMPLDYSRAITINLRLAAMDEPDIIPLRQSPSATPVPPPLV